MFLPFLFQFLIDLFTKQEAAEVAILRQRNGSDEMFLQTLRTVALYIHSRIYLTTENRQ